MLPAITSVNISCSKRERLFASAPNLLALAQQPSRSLSGAFSLESATPLAVRSGAAPGHKPKRKGQERHAGQGGAEGRATSVAPPAAYTGSFRHGREHVSRGRGSGPVLQVPTIYHPGQQALGQAGSQGVLGHHHAAGVAD